MRILHVSDTHGESEAMTRIDNLAMFKSDCDVVAVTGDVVAPAKEPLTAEWNRWPQEHRFLARGNHDQPPSVLEDLQGWKIGAPEVNLVGNLAFVSLPWKVSAAEFEGLSVGDASGVVILVHSIEQLTDPSTWEKAAELVGERPLLVLHGHDHKDAPKWEPNAEVNGKSFYRSHVCSCGHKANKIRGAGHVIEWGDGVSSCTLVQGNEGTARGFTKLLQYC
jgi:predicted phosphodiesterase